MKQIDKIMQKGKDRNDSPERCYQLHSQALDLIEAGKIAEADKIIEYLLRRDPSDPHVDHIRGFLLSELGLQHQALPLLRRAARLLPGKSEPLVTLGISLMRKGDLAEAENVFERALATDPQCPFSQMNLAGCLVAMEKSLERAEQLLRKADQLVPNDHVVWANLGRALSLQGKQAEAEKALRHALAIDPHGKAVGLITDHYPHLLKM